MMYDTPDQAPGDPSTWENYQLMGYHGSSCDKDRVEHDYHDHSKDNDFQDLYPPGMSFHLFPNILGGRGPEQTFPMKLHAMLEQIEKDGLASVVSWQTHGRCFVVHQPEEFVAHILPRYVSGDWEDTCLG
jgi:HSF-type DNA-binding